MVGEVTRRLVRAVNISCVVILAGVYTFTYYDYLHTVTRDNGISISDTQK